MTPMKWTDRRFEFSHSLDLFPNVLERLRGAPVRVREMVHGLPPETLVRRPLAGWSIQEHIGHLGDIEDIHEGRIDDFIFHAQRLRPADLTNRKTHDANHNATDLDTVISRFSSKRDHFIDRLIKLDQDTLQVLSLHPRLEQPMRVIDMMVFTADHDDHHLAWIRALMKRFASS
ncbi:MAG: DinB family protein [Bacteroidetes bacterium]|nr:DinB family protein [Bacteroidota bacterium]